MTVSDYLKTKADLEIAYRMLRQARLEEFATLCEDVEAGAILNDYYGMPVSVDAGRLRAMAAAAGAFVASLEGKRPQGERLSAREASRAA